MQCVEVCCSQNALCGTISVCICVYVSNMHTLDTLCCSVLHSVAVSQMQWDVRVLRWDADTVCLYVCCSVLQCVAVSCSEWDADMVCVYDVYQYAHPIYAVLLQCVTVCCSEWDVDMVCVCDAWLCTPSRARTCTQKIHLQKQQWTHACNALAPVMYEYISTHTHTPTHPHTSTHARIHTHTHTHIHTHKNTLTHAHTHIKTVKHIHMHTWTHTHTCTFSLSNTCARKHTHTHTLSLPLSLSLSFSLSLFLSLTYAHTRSHLPEKLIYLNWNQHHWNVMVLNSIFSRIGTINKKINEKKYTHQSQKRIITQRIWRRFVTHTHTHMEIFSRSGPINKIKKNQYTHQSQARSITQTIW